MSTLAWIIGSSLLMSVIALVGSVSLLLKKSTLDRLILPLISFYSWITDIVIKGYVAINC